jgi:hypothetical protein
MAFFRIQAGQIEWLTIVARRCFHQMSLFISLRKHEALRQVPGIASRMR